MAGHCDSGARVRSNAGVDARDAVRNATTRHRAV
jgi:hypothetical protein